MRHKIAAGVMLLQSAVVSAWDGRLSLAGMVDGAGDSILQQGVRLMTELPTMAGGWSLHLRGLHQQRNGAVEAPLQHATEPFRLRSLRSDALDGEAGASQMVVEVDWLHYRRAWEDFTVTIGRQPLDWGSGHFWQPLNLFGAFAPTDLDTRYKAGIDLALLEWYPQPLSVVTLVHAFAPQGGDHDRSVALHYRQPLGLSSEWTLALGEVIDYRMVGSAIEGSWRDLGWRLEGRYSRAPAGRVGLFWIAGVQHQLEDGLLVDLEWYDHNLGAAHQDDLEEITPDPLQRAGLQPSLGRNLLGLSLAQDLTPLLQGQYTLLVSPLEAGRSQLHQLNLNYSLSDESDLLFSLQRHQGAGLEGGRKRSEFGHLSDQITLRFQHYF